MDQTRHKVSAPRLMVGRRAAVLGALAGLISAAAPRGTSIPIDLSGGHCLLPVLLDGRPARMVLDTGAEFSVITRAAVARLALRPDPWVSTTLRGAAGLLERHANIDIHAASAGGTKLFQRRPDTVLSLPVTSADLGGADGLLGADILRHHSLDLDIPRARLTLTTAQPTPQAPKTMQLELYRSDLLLAPVTLDGHKLHALVDTGSSRSLINARGLYRLGLTPLLLRPDPAVSLVTLGGTSMVRLHHFAELRIGPVRVAAPALLTESVAEPAYDLVLGLDVLGRQRLLLSYEAPALEFAEPGPNDAP